MRPIRKIIIHCSATPSGRETTAADINRWHVNKGFDSIGYHWVIRIDGYTEPGRPEDTPGAHVRGHNHDSIGVCLIGTAEYTPQQWASLEGLISLLKYQYPEADVMGHNDLTDRKTCPNFNVLEWWNDVQHRLTE